MLRASIAGGGRDGGGGGAFGGGGGGGGGGGAGGGADTGNTPYEAEDADGGEGAAPFRLGGAGAGPSEAIDTCLRGEGMW